MNCLRCGTEIEYDEGEGNNADGYTCFVCINICIVPTCNKKMPKWRVKAKRVTCSKICVGIWNHIPSTKREDIRGRGYGRR